MYENASGWFPVCMAFCFAPTFIACLFLCCCCFFVTNIFSVTKTFTEHYHNMMLQFSKFIIMKLKMHQSIKAAAGDVESISFYVSIAGLWYNVVPSLNKVCCSYGFLSHTFHKKHYIREHVHHHSSMTENDIHWNDNIFLLCSWWNIFYWLKQTVVYGRILADGSTQSNSFCVHFTMITWQSITFSIIC